MTFTKVFFVSCSFLALSGLSFGAQAQEHADGHAHEHSEQSADKHADKHVEKAAEGVLIGDPYTLRTCPVSDLELGSMGDSIIKVYDGREVRFCCDGCPEQFEADKDTFIEKIDAMIVADQLPFYPLDECVVTGEPLTVGDQDIAINMVYNNRLVRFCCEMCESDFQDDPAKYTAKLDAAVIAMQRERYPIGECVISGEAMAELADDEVVEVIVANRLFRLCCPPCEPDVLANPAPMIQRLDAAWAQSAGGMPGIVRVSNEHPDEHSDHDNSKSDEHDNSNGHGHGDH